jgi:hypothetical protein
MLSSISAAVIDTIKNFDQLPDDAIVSPKVLAALTGTSARTLRRSPPIPKIKITSQRGGFHVGTIRKLLRGELTTAA